MQQHTDEHGPSCAAVWIQDPQSSQTPACRTAAEDAQTMRRHTNEQDKALDTINDALGDLQRMGEVSTACLSCAWCCCPVGRLTLACQHIASSY